MRRTRMLMVLALLVMLAAVPTSGNAAVTQGELQAICQDLYGDVFGAPTPSPSECASGIWQSLELGAPAMRTPPVTE